MARLWRERWLELQQEEVPIGERLKDAERPGAPTKFTTEQVLKLFAIACEEPEKYGKPISHWTSRELAEVMSEQGVVEKISKRHVGRLRGRSNLKTSTVRILAQSPPDERFDEKVKDICDVYGEAEKLRAQGERVISTDEMTGIQAKEAKSS